MGSVHTGLATSQFINYLLPEFAIHQLQLPVVYNKTHYFQLAEACIFRPSEPLVWCAISYFQHITNTFIGDGQQVGDHKPDYCATSAHACQGQVAADCMSAESSMVG